MLLRDYPEFFGSYKIYEIVKDTMKSYAREKDIDVMMVELARQEATPADFLRKLAIVSKSHVNVAKGSEMITTIKNNIVKLINYKVEPAKLTLTKDGQADLRLFVENKIDGTFKFKAGIQQLDHEYTSIVHDPMKAFSTTTLVRSAVISTGKAHVFKFIIKPDVFGIDDLYELKKENKLVFTIGAQIAADGIDGMKTSVIKIPVEILRHRA